QCGLRAFRKEIFDHVHFKCRDMAFATEMLIVAKARNKRIINIPISYYTRMGKAKLVPYKHGIKIIKWIFYFFILKNIFKKKDIWA
ncbi:MAG: hypothetical protein ACTSXF_00420, partial [Promethearchaeota archaeon]